MKQIPFIKAGLCTFFLLFAGALSAKAQTAPGTPETPAAKTLPQNVPSALVSEWRLFGVDPDMARQMRGRLNQSRNILVKKWADGGSLEGFANKSPHKVPPLLKQFAATLAVSADSKPAAVGASVVYEPVLCRLGDRYVIHLGAADTVLGTLRTAAHTSIDSKQFEADVRDPNRTKNIEEIMTRLAARINVTGDGKTQDNSALHIGMALAKEPTRRDEGSAFCALVLLGQNLAEQKFTVVRPWGSETLGKIRNSLGLPSTLRRPTRTLVFLWDLPRTTAKPQNPMKLKATINIAESVLGQPLPKIPETVWSGQIATDGQISLTAANNSMLDFLTREQNALSLAEAPQVAKINRAWVYLDKGRAYGLEVDDRLVIGGGPVNYNAAIKGHVVGFFGPDKKITSPRGFPVNEGAIVYIRKGQGETKVGQTFVYDETVFPTNYPAAGK